MTPVGEAISVPSVERPGRPFLTHLAHEFPSPVHAQVVVGLLAPYSDLAAEGVGFHYELGL